MADTYSLYTQNGVPTANKIFEKVIFQQGLKVSPVDLIAFQDIVIRDFDNFLFATRGQSNGVYKTEYNTETLELYAGLEVSLQEAVVLNPTSNYELKITKGKAYIGGKLVIVPLDDYVEVPDNDVYPGPETLHLILERSEKYFEPTAIGEPGFALVDGIRTSNRYEAGYILRLVLEEDLPEIDENGNQVYIELAKLVRPPILKTQFDMTLNQIDGDNDEGVNWAKFESNLHILNVEKVSYLFNGISVSKIPSTITQAQWDLLNDNTKSTTLMSGVYYVPYTKYVLIVNPSMSSITQEKIWYMPHSASLELTDTRDIMEDLPSVIDAAFQAIHDIAEHTTKCFTKYVPYGLNDGYTPGPNGIDDITSPNYNPNGNIFWVLPIATGEDIIVYDDYIEINQSEYIVTDVEERTYNENGQSITKELGKITFNTPPAADRKLTVTFYHDAHTIYLENAKHELHRNDISAHPLYINNEEMSEHLANDDIYNTCPDIIDGELPVIAHDNRYYPMSISDSKYSETEHNHDELYSLLEHNHQISEIDTLQEQLIKIEDNIGVYNKTTRLIMEQFEEGVDGLRDHFIIDSLLMQDETVQLIGIRADLTEDSIDNPVILTLLRNPYNITGRIDSISGVYTIVDNYAIFPNGLSGSIEFLDSDNKHILTSTIVSNTETSITVSDDISTLNLNNRFIVNPHTITSIESNFIIKDDIANFPVDGSWVGGNIQVLDNSDIWHNFKIASNTENTITIDSSDLSFDISSFTAVGKYYLVNDFTVGGINPWSEPQKVSYGGKNLGLVISAVQLDDEIWSLWVDTQNEGLTHTLWWSTREKVVGGEGEVWSPPTDTGFNVDEDCRPSIVVLPNNTNPNNEDLMWLFSFNHELYYSYVTYGQTSYSDPAVKFCGGILTNIYSPEGICINKGANNEIWIVYVKEDSGYNGIFLRRFSTNAPYNAIDQEIKISSNDVNCYHPTISQELGGSGNIWIAWGEDNNSYDNSKMPKIKIIDIDTIEVAPVQGIPILTDINFINTFNVDSKMELHHSNNGDTWLVYSILEGGAFKVYYLLLEYQSETNSIINLTPPVELNNGHEVSITERSDSTIWINYNQATQVYSQVRLLGNGEVKWTQSTGELITEVAPEANTFIELRWQLPFVNLESRLEVVESEIRTQSQKLEELETLINNFYNEGTLTYVSNIDWTLPLEYNNNKAKNLRIFVNGLRLRSTYDWVIINDNTVHFTNSTPNTSIIVIEWDQIL
jgi:hypothetical protein